MGIMMRILFLFLTIFIGILSMGIAHADPLPENEWSRILHPTLGTPNPTGFYSHGCISGASTLPLTGTGYQVMRVFRNRYYGDPDLLQFIQELAKAMDILGSGILVGDMGQPRGGPLPYGHASHQIGLDVDVWFWTHPDQRTRVLNTDERNTLPPVSMLNANGVVDPALFTDIQIAKLKAASTNPKVQRIFVNPAIKVYLCSSLPEKDLEWLHKLRPWPGHEEHFHVRLYCPKGSTNCTTQDAVPAGDGCAEVLPHRNGEAEPYTFVPDPRDEHEEEHLDFLSLDQKLDQTVALPPACLDLLKAN